jgi:hypothetical protein
MEWIITYRHLRQGARIAGQEYASTVVNRDISPPVARNQQRGADFADNMITNKVLAQLHESFLRSDEKAIPAHVFFTLKTKADGSFDKVKARIVANGNQQETDDIGDSYAPTVNAISIFMLLHMAVNEDMV